MFLQRLTESVEKEVATPLRTGGRENAEPTGVCARAASDQATVAPLAIMKSRRLNASPEAKDRALPSLFWHTATSVLSHLPITLWVQNAKSRRPGRMSTSPPVASK